MVWRSLKAMVFALALCISMATQTHAYSVYDGNPSSTYLAYFSDMLSKFPISSDYVAFRSGQNEYILAVGNFDFSGGVFSADSDTDICIISSTGNYNGYYRMDFEVDSNFVLSVGNHIIYSNLGNFPTLESRGDIFNVSTIYILATLCLCLCLRSVFEWRRCLRN